MTNNSKPEERKVSELPLRLLGGLVCLIIGVSLSQRITLFFNQSFLINIIALGAIGFILGMIVTPIITIRPLRYVRHRLSNMSSAQLAAVIIGIIMGLVTGGLFAIPLSFLPPPFSTILPLIFVLVFSYLCVFILYYRQDDINMFFQGIASGPSSWKNDSTDTPTLEGNNQNDGDRKRIILLDTSVIIDGRISDISKTGFIRDTILIPTFILRELQHIADSSDAIRRNRGRRGLEVLGMLQESSLAPIEITDIDVSEVRDADSKLVALARQLPCPILTNDYNLNRVAELQGVNVLNVNDLANAVKVAYLPGEDLIVKIIQEGREVGQGIGYLEDGTMVVVEDGMNQMHKTAPVIVTKVLQTSAGRMVFARFPTENEQSLR